MNNTLLLSACQMITYLVSELLSALKSYPITRTPDFLKLLVELYMQPTEGNEWLNDDRKRAEVAYGDTEEVYHTGKGADPETMRPRESWW